MPTVFLPRDQELDETLESEARLTLILVGVGLGILILTTAAIYYGYRLVQILRPVLPLRLLRSSSPIANTADTAEVERTESEITEVDNWSFDTSMAQPKPSLPRRQTEPERTPPSSRIPSFFASIRKHPSVSSPHHLTGVYTGPNNRSPFPRPPPPVRLTSPSISPLPQIRHANNNLHNHPHAQHHHTPTAPQGIVTPHIAAWMKVADSVVGRHPDAKPLSTRVATQAEVDLISGHVHVPWAFRGAPASGAQPPAPVKVMKPVLSAPASALAPAIGQGHGHGHGQPQSQPPPPVSNVNVISSMKSKPSVLKNIGNVRGTVRDVSSANVSTLKTSKRSPKGKAVRRAHGIGKENMPAVPSPLAQSGRHRTN